MTKTTSLNNNSTNTLLKKTYIYTKNPYKSTYNIYKQSNIYILTYNHSKYYTPHYTSFISLNKKNNLPINIYNLKISKINKSKKQKSNTIIFTIFIYKHNQKHFKQY